MFTFQGSWRGEEAAWFYPHLCKAECKASVDCPYDERLLPPYRSWHRHCLPRRHLWVDYKCTHSCPGESFSQKGLWFHLKNMKSLFWAPFPKLRYMAEQNLHFICANVKKLYILGCFLYCCCWILSSNECCRQTGKVRPAFFPHTISHVPSTYQEGIPCSLWLWHGSCRYHLCRRLLGFLQLGHFDLWQLLPQPASS